MIKQNNNLIQNYTDSDLQSFAKLGDFSNYNVVSNDTNANLRSVDVQDKKIIKIVDFDKEKKSKKNNSGKKIKIKTF